MEPKGNSPTLAEYFASPAVDPHSGPLATKLDRMVEAAAVAEDALDTGLLYVAYERLNFMRETLSGLI